MTKTKPSSILLTHFFTPVAGHRDGLILLCDCVINQCQYEICGKTRGGSAMYF